MVSVETTGISNNYLKQKIFFVCIGMLLFLVFSSCAKKIEPPANSICAPSATEMKAGPTGVAYVFNPDPIVSSKNLAIPPSSPLLDDYRSQVTLERLGGRGILEGKYVNVRNGLGCKGGFGAYDEKNQFSYPRSDAHFQEAMSYYFGDEYQVKLDEAGILQAKDPIQIIAHCMRSDNAYFSRGMGIASEKVCLGDSRLTPGASYADDATVIVHELQHGTTADAYSPIYEFGNLPYDEAGSINEGISDFMALAFFDPVVSLTFDPRVLAGGRWVCLFLGILAAAERIDVLSMIQITRIVGVFEVIHQAFLPIKILLVWSIPMD